VDHDRPDSQYASIDDLAEAVTTGERFLLIDLRPRGEYLGGHVKGALHSDWSIDHHQGLMQLLHRHPPRDGTPVLFYCESGGRVSPAAQLAALQLIERGRSFVLHGGYKAFWRKYPNLCVPPGGYMHGLSLRRLPPGVEQSPHPAAEEAARAAGGYRRGSVVIPPPRKRRGSVTVVGGPGKLVVLVQGDVRKDRPEHPGGPARRGSVAQRRGSGAEVSPLEGGSVAAATDSAMQGPPSHSSQRGPLPELESPPRPGNRLGLGLPDHHAFTLSMIRSMMHIK